MKFNLSTFIHDLASYFDNENTIRKVVSRKKEEVHYYNLHDINSMIVLNKEGVISEKNGVSSFFKINKQNINIVRDFDLIVKLIFTSMKLYENNSNDLILKNGFIIKLLDTKKEGILLKFSKGSEIFYFNLKWGKNVITSLQLIYEQNYERKVLTIGNYPLSYIHQLLNKKGFFDGP